MEFDYQWHDFIGNAGVFVILLTYLLLQTGRLSPTTVSYSFLNALGALFILVSLYYSFNLSAVVIEVAWLLISVYGTARAWRARQA